MAAYDDFNMRSVIEWPLWIGLDKLFSVRFWLYSLLCARSRYTGAMVTNFPLKSQVEEPISTWVI